MELQPVETAPRDGSVFLTYRPPHNATDVWLWDTAAWDVDDCEFSKCSCGWDRVTHWAPLPVPTV